MPTARRKKHFEQGSRLGRQQAPINLRVMVQPRLAEHVENAAGGAGLWVWGTDHDPWNAGKHDRAGAHRARLEGHIESRCRQPPSAQLAGRLAQDQHLGMSGRISSLLPSVAGGRKQLSVALDRSTDWGIPCHRGTLSLGKRDSHVTLVQGALPRGGC